MVHKKVDFLMIVSLLGWRVDCNLFSSLDGRIDRGINDWWDHWMEWTETDG